MILSVIQDPNKKYPYIGELKRKEVKTIVLFIGRNKGFILNTNERMCEIGEYRESWYEDIFEKCNDEIILKNK